MEWTAGFRRSAAKRAMGEVGFADENGSIVFAAKILLGRRS
jgi:hypothetical protein